MTQQGHCFGKMILFNKKANLIWKKGRKKSLCSGHLGYINNEKNTVINGLRSLNVFQHGVPSLSSSSSFGLIVSSSLGTLLHTFSRSTKCCVAPSGICRVKVPEAVIERSLGWQTSEGQVMYVCAITAAFTIARLLFLYERPRGTGP